MKQGGNAVVFFFVCFSPSSLGNGKADEIIVSMSNSMNSKGISFLLDETRVKCCRFFCCA